MGNNQIRPEYLVPHFNGRVFRSLYKYVADRYGKEIFREACERLGMPIDYLLRDNTWTSNIFTTDLIDRLKQQTGDLDLLEKSGRLTAAPEILNWVEYLVLSSYPSPFLFLRHLPRQYAKFNRFNKMTVEKCVPGFCKVSVVPLFEEIPNPDVCKNTIGTLAAIKDFFGLDELQVVHPECRHDGGNMCVFELTYSAGKFWRRRLVTAGFFTCSVVASTFAVRGLLTLKMQGLASWYASVGLASVFSLLMIVASRHWSLLNYVTSYFDQSIESSRQLHDERVAAEHSKAQSDLAKGVAHDIRGPLTALQVALNLPADEGKTLIAEAVDRIRNIADLLLTLSSEPTQKREKENVFLNDIIETLVKEKKLIVGHGVGIRFMNSPINVPLNTDKAIVMRVLSNILDNAIESILTEGEVVIRTEVVFGYVAVYITDNGKGIPADILLRLGQEPISYDKKAGTGLGVFNSRKLIASVGGKFSISSKVGYGTTVRLDLPLTPA